MDRLIAALIAALNDPEFGDRFGRVDRIDGENVIGVEFEGETYFLEITPA